MCTKSRGVEFRTCDINIAILLRATANPMEFGVVKFQNTAPIHPIHEQREVFTNFAYPQVFASVLAVRHATSVSRIALPTLASRLPIVGRATNYYVHATRSLLQPKQIHKNKQKEDPYVMQAKKQKQKHIPYLTTT